MLLGLSELTNQALTINHIDQTWLADGDILHLFLHHLSNNDGAFEGFQNNMRMYV